MEQAWSGRLVAAALLGTVLTGCGGGGGGGGGGAVAPAGGLIRPNEGTPVSAAALTTPQITANTNADIVDTLVAALAFPLYPLRSTAVAEGVRSQAANGAVTMTYRSTTGPRSFTFAPNEFTSSDAEGFIAEKGTTTLYSEFWADATQAWRLNYSRLGTFFYEDASNSQVSLFYYGAETPTAQMPVSAAPNLGTAQYDGKTSGYVFGANPGTLSGDVRLLVNFATDRFTGVFTNLTTEPATGPSQPLGVSFVVDTTNDDARVTREAIGARIAGSIAAVNDTTNARISCCGNVVGRFFGPAANELSGGWLYDVNDLSIRAVFGTTRDVSQNLNPGAIFATSAAQRVGSAPDTSFPMYSLNAIDGIRRQNASGLALTYSDAGFPVNLAFSNANISSAGGITTATTTGATWREITQVDSTNGALAYARFGHLNATAATSPKDRFYTFGYETPVASIPTLGSAEYYGQTIGTLTNGTTVEALAGLVNLSVNFVEGSVAGRISTLTVTDAGGAIRPFGHVAMIDGELFEANGNGSHFTAALNRTTQNGRLTGRFYGPALEEVAGAWTMTVTDGTAEGVFGARTGAATHPSGAPALAPWVNSTGTSFLSTDTLVVATFANTNAVPTFTLPTTTSTTLRPLADGGITWTNGALQASLPGDAFDTRTVPFTTNHPNTQIRQVADEDDFAMTMGGAGFLSYARFGYWEDSTADRLQPRIGFFASGRETPAGSMPTSGTATFVGSSAGLALTPDGYARIDGALTLRANFGLRTVDGEITGMRAEFLARTNPSAPAPTLPFAMVQLYAGTIVGNGFTGSAGALSPGNAALASGTMDGRFFGPQAQEVGGRWEVRSPDATGTIQAWGSFGGVR